MTGAPGDSRGDSRGGEFPDVPAYAWAWLQRSRPVVYAVAEELTGGPPEPGFVEGLAPDFAADAFVRSVVVRVIAEVAFNGRVPQRRPAGVSWDRGLRWWAAALAGVSLAEFEARPVAPSPQQRRLFDQGEDDLGEDGLGVRPRTARAGRGAAERAAVARALREILACADGDQVAVSVIRSLLAQVDPTHQDPSPLAPPQQDPPQQDPPRQ